MKMAILLATVFCSVSSFANSGVVFKNNSVLPSDVKNSIQVAIDTHCDYITKRAWQVVESKSEIVDSEINYTTVHYKTMFTVMAMDNDNMHPYMFPMTVQYADKNNSKPLITISAQSYCQYNNGAFLVD